MHIHAGRLITALVVGLALVVPACGDDDRDSGGSRPTLKIGAIPDQDPQELQRLYGTVADHLSRKLRVKVAYRPVTDYPAAVTAFRVGDMDLVWFGGLTSVQAQRQVKGATAIAQRDIDAAFHSVVIAKRDSGIGRIRDASGLKVLKGHTFTFGSESSTSGRLMPQYYLERAGVELGDFRGKPGFSGSHDKTIDLVRAGTYDAGALNEQVWRDRKKKGTVGDTTVVWRSPAYPDYQWVIRPDVDDRFGDGFTARVRRVLLGLRDETILDLFGAKRFIPTKAGSHAVIERAGRETGLLR